MNFFSHIVISKTVYNYFKDRMDLKKAAFIYGNIKPDLSSRVMKTPHLLDNYFMKVCKNAGSLMEGKYNDINEFSVELGQVCHYICDFFCRYHLNNEIYHQYRNHFFYEIKLHFILLRFNRKRKSIVPANSKNARRDIASIILEMRNDYFSEPISMEKDVSYALSSVIWVCDSVRYYLDQPAAKPAAEKTEKMGIIPA
mgnify:FL=1